ncbi:hypothetical protein [Jonesia quinghaiensis]|uniref:hypothetical protein n=1 Tax=Jonesia quinghaiensis TaxID=262806 RepID=UPI00041C526D|nr:hypothetical protein [Jonesia quinghaiensis]
MSIPDVRDLATTVLWYRNPADAGIVLDRLQAAGITEEALDRFFVSYDPRNPEIFTIAPYNSFSDDQKLLLLSEYAHRQGKLSELVADQRRAVITAMLATRSLSSIAHSLGVTKQAVHKIARSARTTD